MKMRAGEKGLQMGWPVPACVDGLLTHWVEDGVSVNGTPRLRCTVETVGSVRSVHFASDGQRCGYESRRVGVCAHLRASVASLQRSASVLGVPCCAPHQPCRGSLRCLTRCALRRESAASVENCRGKTAVVCRSLPGGGESSENHEQPHSVGVASSLRRS